MDEKFWLETCINMRANIPVGSWREIKPKHVEEIRRSGCRALTELTSDQASLRADIDKLKRYTDEAYAEYVKGYSAADFFDRFIQAERVLLEQGALSLKVTNDIINELQAVRDQVIDKRYWNDDLFSQFLLLKQIVCGWQSEPNESAQSAAKRAWSAIKGATVLSTNGSAAFAISTMDGGFSGLLGLGPGMSIKGGAAMVRRALKGRW